MTREEAIQVLQDMVMRFVPTDQYGDYDDPEPYEQAIDMAIEALQREVPKNPVVNLVSDADGSRRLNEGWTESALLCPVCHTWFGEVFDEGYCRRCGQKLIQKRVRVIEP